MENLESVSENQEILYISDSCDNEKSENVLLKYANIVKVLGFVICGLIGIVGFITMFNDDFSPFVGIGIIFYAAILVLLVLVYVAFVKVFVNISMSLKDITKLLNR